MSHRGKSRRKPAAGAQRGIISSAVSAVPSPLTGWKLWRLRLLAIFGVPVAFLFLAELCLRLAGVGYPTAFLLPYGNDGQPSLVQNNRFGWRFFGPQMARLPYPLRIPKTKPPGTVRIFVFGESAAYGDPRPAFGLSRMLGALLSERHPGVRFEVVNAAMTGINSHTLLPIARDCADAEGDIWVFYMGNNEVVGPFGAGTIFGNQVPPLPVIRANLALKTLRLGQLLDSARQWWQKPVAAKSEWGGMMMFLDQKVTAADPRMVDVYHHFERNLADMIRAGQKNSCGIVLSTMAVNLKDCPPFASMHRPDLSPEQLRQWDELFHSGAAAQEAGHFSAAADFFTQAARLDDTFAELRFRQAECAGELKQSAEAAALYSTARDLDALRFRCDSRLNEIIRQAASHSVSKTVRLADSEKVFGEQSPDGVPGGDLFYEHVHLTFAGNYLLARTIAAQIEPLLPPGIDSRAAPDRAWASLAECARRLGWTEMNSQAAYSEMMVRVQDPPFTAQLNHRAELARLQDLAKPAKGGSYGAEVTKALRSTEAALSLSPEDPVILDALASLKQNAHDLTGAETDMRHSLNLLPTSSEGWSRLGMILVQRQNFTEAAAAFRRQFELDREDVSALQNLAMSLVKQGRDGDAIIEYRRALAIKPRFGPAWLGLGQVLEKMGKKTEAMNCFQQALANRIHRASDLSTLARFCATRGWFEAAATNYSAALTLSPADPALNYEAGQTQAALKRHVEAAKYFATAADLAPDWGQAQFECGVELGIAGQPEGATERFRQAVRLMPDVIEARLNLGVALHNQKHYREALAEFEEVLQRSPTNRLAAQYVQGLQKALSKAP
jgi:tetratricopeptide (TPR) repeat protein